MARQANYNVTAYDMDGATILTQRTTTKLECGRIARAMLAYSNVYTVEVTNTSAANVADYKVGNYVKTGARVACYIPNGGAIRNVRIAF